MGYRKPYHGMWVREFGVVPIGASQTSRASHLAGAEDGYILSPKTPMTPNFWGGHMKGQIMYSGLQPSDRLETKDNPQTHQCLVVELPIARVLRKLWERKYIPKWLCQGRWREWWDVTLLEEFELQGRLLVITPPQARCSWFLASLKEEKILGWARLRKSH